MRWKRKLRRQWDTKLRRGGDKHDDNLDEEDQERQERVANRDAGKEVKKGIQKRKRITETKSWGERNQKKRKN